VEPRVGSSQSPLIFSHFQFESMLGRQTTASSDVFEQVFITSALYEWPTVRSLCQPRIRSALIRYNSLKTLVLITAQELREVEAFLSRCERDERRSSVDTVVRASVFWGRRPHLLMPLGFDDYVGFTSPEQCKAWWFEREGSYFGKTQRDRSIFRKPTGQWLLLSSGPRDRANSPFTFESKRSFGTEEFAL
jgi:hypothetical protein